MFRVIETAKKWMNYGKRYYVILSGNYVRTVDPSGTVTPGFQPPNIYNLHAATLIYQGTIQTIFREANGDEPLTVTVSAEIPVHWRYNKPEIPQL